MNINLKRIIVLMLTLILILGASVTSFAVGNESINKVNSDQSINLSNEVGPLGDVLHYHIIKNKVYKYTNQVIHSYYTTVWAPASQYTIESTKTTTIGLTATPTAGSFLTSLVVATGAFNASYSKTVAVGTLVPADPSRDSKLTLEAQYKNYTGDLYYVIDYGYSKTESYKGSGTVKEPKDLFVRVLYRTQ